MIVYLCTKEYALKLAFLEERNIVVQEKSDMTGEQLLNYMKMDLRNLDVNLLFIDIGIFKSGQDEEIITALKTFDILFPSGKVILLHKGEVPKDLEEQYQVLEMEKAEENILQILDHPTNTENEETAISDEVDEYEEKETSHDTVVEEERKIVEEEKQEVVLTPSSTTQEFDVFKVSGRKIKTHEGDPLGQRVREMKSQAEEKKAPQLVKLCNSIKWTCSNVIIAVTGSQRRTGATTLAMRLCDYLNKNGAHVCYSEATLEVNKHLSCIAEDFNFDVVEASYRKENITYYRDSSYDTEAGYNFIVLDLGAVEERPKWIAAVIGKIADEVILVANGARKYEEESLKRSLDVFSGIPVRINVVINSTSESRFKVFTEQNKDDRVQFKRGEYETVFFNATRVEEEIAELLKVHNV